MANYCDLDQVQEKFAALCVTISKLRDPDSGCPWDLKQTHESLRKYLIEESYEASEALGSGDRDQMIDELGDVLLQVVLNAQLGHDQDNFNISDVIDAINQKMIRRHPHVFNPEASEQITNTKQLHKQWQDIKNDENPNKDKSEIFSKLPPSPLLQADEIGKQSRSIDFDWDHTEQVFEKLKSEVVELEQALTASKFQSDSHVYSELGDVFFSLSQLCRHLGHSSEIVSMDGNRKFLNRFYLMKGLMTSDGIDIENCEKSHFEHYWERAKSIKPAKSE